MKMQNNNYQNSQFLNLKQWKEKVIKFIKEVILDIIKLRINKNAFDVTSNNIENDYEQIDLNSLDLKRKISEENKKRKNFDSEYNNLRANDFPNSNDNDDDSNEFKLGNKSNIINKYSDGFLYLNFSELDEFQLLNSDYKITISILFRRKEIQFVIENWNFEVNLSDQNIKNANNQRNSFTNNSERKSFIYKKLEIFQRTIKTLLNILPIIKFFHSNSFDFYLDFELNMEKIDYNKEKKSKENLKNEEIPLENFDYFKTKSPNKVKYNSEFNKNNTTIPIDKQMEYIKVLGNSKKIFNFFKNEYTDKIGKIKISVEYLDKFDVFLIEEEIQKKFILYEKIKKRKRFISDYNQEEYSEKNKDKNHSITKEEIVLKNLQNSFSVQNSKDKNNNLSITNFNNDSKNIPIEQTSKLKENLNFNLFKENEEKSSKFISLEENINENSNQNITKSLKLFEKIIKECEVNSPSRKNNTNKSLKKLSFDNLNKIKIYSKSEEKDSSNSKIFFLFFS